MAVPAGTATWTSTLNITKNITLQGAGAESTIIVDDVPQAHGNKPRHSGKIPRVSTKLSVRKAPRRSTNPEKRQNKKPGGSEGNGAPLISITLKRDLPFRMTGFTVKGLAQDTTNNSPGTIVIYGSSRSVRVDHVKFDRPGTGAMKVKGVYGVVDHCYFDEPNGKFGVQVEATGFGDESFGTPANLGTADAFFIEDCTFVSNGRGGHSATNPTSGGRVVFRHNTLINQNTAGHGTEGARQRGMRSVEIYQNTFITDTVMNKGVQLRGGTGVVWGNTFQSAPGASGGYQNVIACLNFRSFNNYPNFGRATGSNPWDHNTDSTGYEAIDQVGMGLCQDQIRNNPPVNQRTGTAAWPTQQRDLIYVWSNTFPQIPNKTVFYISNMGPSPCIRIGRDIINNGTTPEPGYKPYTYPHPLVSGVSVASQKTAKDREQTADANSSSK